DLDGIADWTFNENDSSMKVTVGRFGSTEGTSKVDWQIVDVTTISGTNYAGPTTARLTFNPGETRKVITIPILYDHETTGPLEFNFELSNASSNAIIRDFV